MENLTILVLLAGVILFLILIGQPRRKPRLTNRQIAYREYLQSDHWKALRAERKLIDGNQCQGCRSRKSLQVHHTNYHNELPYPQSWYACTVRDVVTLCERCHQAEHSNKSTFFTQTY